MWREFEDGQRWRALAVQARTFRDDQSATLSPATTEVYLPWWPEHSRAWAARYARDRKLAAKEYGEVEALWAASKEALDFERARLERERHLRKRAQIGALIAAVLFVVSLVALGIGGWYFHEARTTRQQAVEQKVEAQKQKARRRRASRTCSPASPRTRSTARGTARSRPPCSRYAACRPALTRRTGRSSSTPSRP